MWCVERFGMLAVALIFTAQSAFGQTTTKVIDNGADNDHIVIGILAEGYSRDDQAKFGRDVDRIITGGAFGHDFFRDHRARFNAYRIGLESQDSGVTQSLTGKAVVPRNTALRTIYNGDWERSWIQTSDDTLTRVVAAVDFKCDYYLVILNETGWGGVAYVGGNVPVQFITAGPESEGAGTTNPPKWETVAHEWGHGIGQLYDEYSQLGAYSGPPINRLNASTVASRDGVVWKDLIRPNTPIPTSFDESTMDPNQTVGLFEGGDTYTTGVYRPVFNCRMSSNTPPFCPVCAGDARGDWREGGSTSRADGQPQGPGGCGERRCQNRYEAEGSS